MLSNRQKQIWIFIVMIIIILFGIVYGFILKSIYINNVRVLSGEVEASKLWAQYYGDLSNTGLLLFIFFVPLYITLFPDIKKVRWDNILKK